MDQHQYIYQPDLPAIMIAINTFYFSSLINSGFHPLLSLIVNEETSYGLSRATLTPFGPSVGSGVTTGVGSSVGSVQGRCARYRCGSWFILLFVTVLTANHKYCCRTSMITISFLIFYLSSLLTFIHLNLCNLHSLRNMKM